MKRTPVRPSLKAIARRAELPRSTKKIRSRGKRKCYQHLRRPDFKKWAVANYPCEVEGKPILLGLPHLCVGRLEFCHVQNEGIGGPDIGNGIVLCTGAHTGFKWSWHRNGKQSFQRQFGFDAVARAREIGARFLADHPEYASGGPTE